MDDAKSIYRIAEADDWARAQAEGAYHGAALDQRDGFLHLSTREQVAETLALHYEGREGLILLTVSVAAVEPDLRWEPSRGGALFPHLFRSLSIEDVTGVTPLVIDAQGRHGPMP